MADRRPSLAYSLGLPVLSLIPKAVIVERGNKFIRMLEEQWELVRPSD